jgi:hypothetical protein
MRSGGQLQNGEKLKHTYRGVRQKNHFLQGKTL